MRTAIVVQGLFERSDSIGYDACFQFRQLRALFPTFEIRLFAERSDADLYPDIQIDSYEELPDFCSDRDAKIIYHYCDGWKEFDEYLFQTSNDLAIRWHNNTSPWFYGIDNLALARRTVGGFTNIVKFFARSNTEFWVNSGFTGRQLETLGGSGHPRHVVYPASRFLDGSHDAVLSEPKQESVAGSALRILFVSRVVAHKGHRHIIACASTVSKAFGIPIRVDFPGRPDRSAIKFNQSLKDIAESSGVEVYFHGEVTEAELIDLYKNADVFVCLSEHEGFGMPVFEAIRTGTPIVAWASTALKELLIGHPFAFEEFDIPKFSAAIYSLQKPEVRNYVLARQARLLSRYTLEKVQEQLSRAFSGQTDRSPYEDEVLWNDEEELADGCVEEALIEECRAAYLGLPDIIRSLPHDSPDNYVTLYDLEVYNGFFEKIADARLAGLNATPTSAEGPTATTVSAGEFSTHSGNRDPQGAIAHDLMSRPFEHIVFGPYIGLPEGRFAIAFQYALTCPPDSTVSMFFDVVGQTSGVLAQGSSPICELAMGSDYTLEIVNNQAGDTFEFRACVDGPSEGRFVFRGVKIHRLATVDSLVADAKIEVVKTEARSVRKASSPKRNPIKRLLGGILVPQAQQRESLELEQAQQARERFAAGDEARDAGRWERAAHCYEEGLAIDPEAFEYWIQLGNALKEAGQMAASERAYKRAEAINPTDPEVHLQFGHLYKVSGRLSLAEKRYLQSLAGNSAVIHAYLELRALGLTPAALMEFAEKIK